MRIMFGLGLPEWIILLFIVLLFFGADHLPKIVHSLGKALNEFKKEMQGVHEESSSEQDKEKK
jgi:sec-independent protein translocase protein TatA